MSGFWRYLGRRMALLPIGLFVVVTLSFALVNLAPGDPARAIAGGLADEETLQEIRVDLGLAEPIPQRYASYLGDLARGDLGTSYFTNLPITQEIWERLPDSLELIVMSLTVAVVLGLAVGGIGAYYRGRAADRISRLATSALQSIPDFFLGLLLIYLLFFLLGWAPAPVGRIGLMESRPPRVSGGLLIDAAIAGDWEIFASGLRHSIMPVLALGLFYSAYFAKTTRAVLAQAFASRQVEFARACGLPTRTIWAYALRQARTPILTYGAILFAVLIGGAAIVEIVFAWGGIGEWAVDRILSLDIPAIQGFVLVAGIITLITYVALDVLVARLDPRITYGAEGS
ncbi:ABC transporter permease [Euzebya tangerina]|uniref:ABC transporter permease n=1 Tax=Euzebya tangerina TaxID=591198 RepID=UPI000E321E3A|nr:ABC transporter permease [Euzebya tangerina]